MHCDRLTDERQDENFELKHTAPGLLSMVRILPAYPPRLKLTRTGKLGPQHKRVPGEQFSLSITITITQLNRPTPYANSFTPQFFITTEKCDFLDGKHVVFGKVIDGMLTLRKIENVPTGPNNRPKLAVKIVGELMIVETNVLVINYIVIL